MAKKAGVPKANSGSETRRHTAMVRIGDEARYLGASAAKLLGVSLADYITDMVVKTARRDIERQAKKIAGGEP